MPLASAGGPLAAVHTVTGAWPMAFTSVHFLLFLPVAAAVYFLLPKNAVRRAWLLFASYYFYFFTAPNYLWVLLCGTLVSFLCGLFIAAGKPGHRTGRLMFSVALMVLGLCFFKYNGFFEGLLAPLLGGTGLAWPEKYFTTAGALGISFYTFTALGYLIDTARGDIPPEKNLLNYALFLGFFPSVTMGPISRAGGLLPQLTNDTRPFDAVGASDGLRTMAIGFFKKLAVADTLAVLTAQIFGNLTVHFGLTLTFGAVAFAVQLYFDFSGYSDIAIGAARILGIKLPENFKNPYFATNFSAFWSRWHMSLSTFLQDYIFTPLVWSRWTEKIPFLGKKVTKPPVLSSLAIVFLVSGIWHGDTLCFLVWGGLQAAFRIGEEVCHRTIGKPKKNPKLAMRVGKTALVLVLWVESLVFFKVGMAPTVPGSQVPGTVAEAFSALVRQFQWQPLATFAGDIYSAVFNGFFPFAPLVPLFLIFCFVCTATALWADWAQCFKLGSAPLSDGLKRLKPAPRWLIYFAIVLCCFAAFLMQNGGFAGGSFLYGGF